MCYCIYLATCQCEQKSASYVLTRVLVCNFNWKFPALNQTTQYVMGFLNGATKLIPVFSRVSLIAFCLLDRSEGTRVNFVRSSFLPHPNPTFDVTTVIIYFCNALSVVSQLGPICKMRTRLRETLTPMCTQPTTHLYAQPRNLRRRTN